MTCIKWIPGTPNLFLVSYSSGFMYVYNHELVCPPTAPVYQTFMQGEGYSVHTCKTKTTRWVSTTCFGIYPTLDLYKDVQLLCLNEPRLGIKSGTQKYLSKICNDQ